MRRQERGYRRQTVGCWERAFFFDGASITVSCSMVHPRSGERSHVGFRVGIASACSKRSYRRQTVERWERAFFFDGASITVSCSVAHPRSGERSHVDFRVGRCFCVLKT